MSHAGAHCTHCSLQGGKEATETHVASPAVQSGGFSSLQLPLEAEAGNYSERFGACARVWFAPPVSPAVSCSFIILPEPSVKYGWLQRLACLSKSLHSYEMWTQFNIWNQQNRMLLTPFRLHTNTQSSGVAVIVVYRMERNMLVHHFTTSVIIFVSSRSLVVLNK